MSDFADDEDGFEEDGPDKLPQGMSRLRMAFARWWIILVFAILGYVVALYTLSIAEPSHEATAVLEVVTKEKRLVGAELEQDKLAVDKTLATLASKLVGPSQLTKVVNSAKVQSIERAVPPEFSLKPKYWRSEEELRFTPAAEAGTADVVKMITDNVKVVPRQGTTLIDITVTHKDAGAAVAIADAIMEQYLKTEEQRKAGGATEAFKILRAEANDAAVELETARRALETYNAVLAMNKQLNSARDNIAMLKQRYLPKHPKMIQARLAHAALKRRFRREMLAVTQSPGEVEFWIQHREKMEAFDKAAEGGDDARKKEAEEGWLTLVQSALAARSGLLQSRIANKQALYDTVTKRITEIDVAEENDQGEVKIAEHAYPSGNVETDKYVRLAQGVFGGALLGFGIAYLLGMVDYKIYDVRTVEEAVGLPCLAAVPEGAVFDLDDEWKSVLEAEPKTASAEAFRNLRASVMLLGKAERHKSILVTSSAPSEGKTTIASELAASFALNDQKTILVDLDLRKPRVHTLFPKTNHDIGMAQVLSGQEDLAKAIQKTGVKGLHVICAGAKAPNPSELLQEGELVEIISKLSGHYDRVIIDTPPVLPVSDTRLLARHVQTTILVVRALKGHEAQIPRLRILRLPRLRGIRRLRRLWGVLQ